VSAGLKAYLAKSAVLPALKPHGGFMQAISLSIQAPLTAAAHEGIARYCHQYALCIHDCLHLAFKNINKSDTYAITHETDIGYDLQTSPIVSDQTGQPIAPVALRLVSADGSYMT
jgi:hypothetical protein